MESASQNAPHQPLRFRSRTEQLQKMQHVDHTWLKPGNRMSQRRRWEGSVKLKCHLVQHINISGSRHFPPLVAHFHGAAARGDLLESLPLSVLAELDPQLAAFCTQLDDRCERDLALRMSYIKMAASQAAAQVQVNETEGGGVWIQRLEARERVEGSEEAPQLPQQFEAVVAPADTSAAVRQETVTVGGGEYFLDKISHLLGLPSAAHLLLSREVGKRGSGVRVYSAIPSPPSPAPLHPSASWLSGQDHCGDVVVAAVGSCHRSAGKGEMVWARDVTAADYLSMLLHHTPEGMFHKGRAAPLGHPLPALYTTSGKWRGSDLPAALLHTHCLHHKAAFRAPPDYAVFSVDSSSGERRRVECSATGPPQADKKRKQDVVDPPPGAYSATVVVHRGSGFLEASSRGCHRLAKEALQGAALEALRRLQAEFEEREAPRVLPWGCRDSGALPLLEAAGVLRGVPEEEGPLPHSGCLVQLSYTMLWRGVVVEQVEGVEVEVGCGALVAPLEEWVSRMRAGQTCEGRLQVGPSPCFHLRGGHGVQEVETSVRLLSCTFPREEQLEAALFTPPLAKQRCQVALDLIATAGADSVIDLGCGDGSLLHHLASGSTCGRLVGVDISERGLKQAVKAVRGGRPVSLYSGSIVQLDDRFCDFDLAVCLEVVEHLDPEPLAALGAAVLAGLRPKAFLLSTPNKEYNALIHTYSHQRSKGPKGPKGSKASKGGELGVGALRNEDHRFEWTRVEFEAWAGRVGGEYGYEVEWLGVGNIAGEEAAGVGFATQMALFRRTGGVEEVATPDWLPKTRYTLLRQAAEEKEVADGK